MDKALLEGFKGGWLGTTEIFSLETMTWRSGPTITSSTGELSDIGEASVRTRNGFRIAGGDLNGNVASNRVYEFDAGSYEWTRLEETMVEKREFHAVIALPDSDDYC